MIVTHINSFSKKYVPAVHIVYTADHPDNPLPPSAGADLMDCPSHLAIASSSGDKN
jgi:hypothetical protein